MRELFLNTWHYILGIGIGHVIGWCHRGFHEWKKRDLNEVAMEAHRVELARACSNDQQGSER